MNKLSFTDNFGDVIMKLSEGNPGAMTALFQLCSYDNDKFYGFAMTLDAMQLYGSHLYMLCNDCCNRDSKKIVSVLRAYCDGVITDKDINERIKNVGYGESFDDLIDWSKYE